MKRKLFPQQKTVLRLLQRANGGVVTYRLIEINLWPDMRFPPMTHSWTAIVRHMKIDHGIPIETVKGVGFRLPITGEQA